MDFYSGTKVCQNSAFGLFLKTDMNQSNSFRNHEGLPPQGLSEADRGKEVFFKILVTDPPRGRPFEGGGIHRIRGYRGISPDHCNSFNTCITHGKPAKSQDGNTTFSHKVQELKGGGTDAVPFVYTGLLYISLAKRNNSPQQSKTILLTNAVQQW